MLCPTVHSYYLIVGIPTGTYSLWQEINLPVRVKKTQAPSRADSSLLPSLPSPQAVFKSDSESDVVVTH
eukprot:3501421-Rhodomonas_salina.1